MVARMKNRSLALSALLVLAMLVHARAAAPIPLWPNGAPGALGTEDKDIPTLTPFVPESAPANGAAVVVCPGGGYQGLAGYEGKDYAQ